MTELPSSRIFRPAGPLRGIIRAPGDKSISHRVLILAAMAVGRSSITGLSISEDVGATARALERLGVRIHRHEDDLQVDGVGIGTLLQPHGALDLGNSGTGARLLAGLVASHSITTMIVGDPSLSRRPMNRIADPLSAMGAHIETTPGGYLPMTIRGIAPAVPIRYRLPIASAQVKSALLLAALNTPGKTTILEPVRTRDHTERLLAQDEVAIEIGEDNGLRTIAVSGPCELTARQFQVPGDPSSAAFPVVAALLVPGSDILVENVCTNPMRTGLFDILQAMGGDLTFERKRQIGGEQVADIRARHSALDAIELPPDIAPRMIDEYPIFFLAAALANGRSIAHGLGELKIKESDRLTTMADALEAIGVTIERFEDGLAIEGTEGEVIGSSGPVNCSAVGDHRVAMSLAVAGLASRGGVAIDDMRCVATSFPDFEMMLSTLCTNQMG